MLTLVALINEIETMLQALRVPYQKVPLDKNLPPAFIVDRFGTVIVGFERVEYSIILNRINNSYKDYRFIPVTTMDNMLEVKDKVVWELMRGGYMRYIRTSYPAQFKTLIFEYGLGRKIINERLRIWNDRPQFKYLIEENKAVLEAADNYTLAVDPAFYDYMPYEIVIPTTGD